MMELDVSILIKNATIDDLQRLFGKQDISSIYPRNEGQTVVAASEIKAGQLVAFSPKENVLEIPKKKHGGDKNAERWSDAEMDPVRTNLVFEVAWTKYQKQFPASTRNRSTVQQRWNKLHPKAKRGKTPKVEKKGPISALQQPKTSTKVERILQDNDPIVEEKKDTPKEKPKSEKLLSNLNLNWSDAERLVIQDLPDWRDAVAAYRKAIPDSKRTYNSIKQQWKKIAAGVVKKRRGPEKKSDEVMPPKPFPSPTATTPATVPPASQKGVTDFTIGTHVKQVKPYLDRQVSGCGIVTGHKQGLVEVNFSGHQYYKIDPSCLESL